MNWPKTRTEAAVYFVKAGTRVLDVGCGYGELLKKLESKFRELYGIEINGERVQRAIANLKKYNAHIAKGSIEDTTDFEDNYFDAIISSDVIEHVADVFAAFREMTRVLRKGGQLITITPNIADLRRRLTLLYGRFPSTSAKNEGLDFQDGTERFDGGHLHYFTYSVLEKLYKKHGYISVNKYGYGGRGRLHNLWPSLLSPSCVVVGIKGDENTL